MNMSPTTALERHDDAHQDMKPLLNSLHGQEACGFAAFGKHQAGKPSPPKWSRYKHGIYLLSVIFKSCLYTNLPQFRWFCHVRAMEDSDHQQHISSSGPMYLRYGCFYKCGGPFCEDPCNNSPIFGICIRALD